VDRRVRLKNASSGLKTLKDENFILLSRQSLEKQGLSLSQKMMGKKGSLVSLYEGDRVFISLQL